MLFLLAASLSGWMVALAQEGKSTPALLDMSLEELMNVEVETVYAASRHQQKVTEAPAAIHGDHCR
jgi:hypothetical protein